MCLLPDFEKWSNERKKREKQDPRTFFLDNLHNEERSTFLFAFIPQQVTAFASFLGFPLNGGRTFFLMYLLDSIPSLLNSAPCHVVALLSPLRTSHKFPYFPYVTAEAVMKAHKFHPQFAPHRHWLNRQPKWQERERERHSQLKLLSS